MILAEHNYNPASEHQSWLNRLAADLEKRKNDNSCGLGSQPELCGFRYGPCYGSSNNPEGLILKPSAKAPH